jgi:hypothetical protein
MQSWQTTYLGLKDLPRELSSFELQAFFTFSSTEHVVIAARRGATHKLGLALHIGFLRLSGRSLNAVRVLPASLWAHLGKELDVRAGTSLPQSPVRPQKHFVRTSATGPKNSGLSRHDRTSKPCFRTSPAQRGKPPARLKEQITVFAKRWLYEHKYLIEINRALQTQITSAMDLFETQTGAVIATTVPAALQEKWRQTLAQLRPDGQTQQSWLWEAPAKHSTVQIAQVFERIDLLYMSAPIEF